MGINWRPGDDRILDDDDNADIINCGKGRDTVFYDDGADSIKACENKPPV